MRVSFELNRPKNTSVATYPAEHCEHPGLSAQILD